MIKCAARICEILGLETTPSVWVDYSIPTAKAMRVLNNPLQLKQLFQSKTGIQIDAAQTAIFLRLVTLLEMQTEGSIDYANETEEEAYKEIELLEEQVVSQASELLKLIVEFKRLQKLHSMDLGAHISPVTNSIHSSYDSNGAATGRLASRNVNGQNISGRTAVQIEIPLNLLC